MSAEVAGVPAGMLATAALKSKAVPGVLGVLVAEPNEAKAPEPRPKAEEPPIVGEARALVVSGGMALKGLRPPCEDESPPKRLVVAEKVRAGGSWGWSTWAVERESLLVLGESGQSVSRAAGGEQRAGLLGSAGPEVLPVVHW